MGGTRGHRHIRLVGLVQLLFWLTSITATRNLRPPTLSLPLTIPRSNVIFVFLLPLLSSKVIMSKSSPCFLSFLQGSLGDAAGHGASCPRGAQAAAVTL